jgi:hypothetical protein
MRCLLLYCIRFTGSLAALLHQLDAFLAALLHQLYWIIFNQDA